MGSNVMKIVIGIVGLTISFLVFPIVMSSAHTIHTDEEVATYTKATGAGETTVECLLTRSLYDSDTNNVVSIANTWAGTETAVASSYVSATKALTVGGLVASGTRTLTITYEYDATTNWTGLGDMIDLSPFILFMAILLSGISLVWGAVKEFGGGFGGGFSFRR